MEVTIFSINFVVLISMLQREYSFAIGFIVLTDFVQLFPFRAFQIGNSCQYAACLEKDFSALSLILELTVDAAISVRNPPHALFSFSAAVPVPPMSMLFLLRLQHEQQVGALFCHMSIMAAEDAVLNFALLPAPMT